MTRHWFRERVGLLRRELFVAMARARDRLWAGWVGEPPELLAQVVDARPATASS